MQLVFAATLPHSPLLIPNIGKDNLSFFPQTINAARELAQGLKEASPDCVLIISAYGPRREQGFVMNVSPSFQSDLSAFGDLVTDSRYTGSLSLPARLREALEGKCSLQLTTQEKLDYGSFLPLYLLQVSATLPILPLSPSSGSLKDNFAYGRSLQECLFAEDQRVAIIASADLSHKLSKKSPAGFSAKAKKLDQKIIDSLIRNDVSEILALNEKTLNEALVEDMNSLAVFLGLIEGYELSGRLLSYEAPFGVGHPLISYQLP